MPRVPRYASSARVGAGCDSGRRVRVFYSSRRASPLVGCCNDRRREQQPTVRHKAHFSSCIAARVPLEYILALETPRFRASGRVAQLVEQRTENPRAEGSSPPPTTMNNRAPAKGLFSCFAKFAWMSDYSDKEKDETNCWLACSLVVSAKQA